MRHSVVIIGQSNMAGRGFPSEVTPLPTDSFADLYSKEHEVDMGIIPCADGGTSLDQWCVGGLGDYLQDNKCSDDFKNYIHVNEALKRVAEKSPMTGFVPAEGLGCNPDYLRFSSVALREFGARYYSEFKKLEDPNKVFVEKNTKDNAIRTEIENL